MGTMQSASSYLAISSIPSDGKMSPVGIRFLNGKATAQYM